MVKIPIEQAVRYYQYLEGKIVPMSCEDIGFLLGIQPGSVQVYLRHKVLLSLDLDDLNDFINSRPEHWKQARLKCLDGLKDCFRAATTLYNTISVAKSVYDNVNKLCDRITYTPTFCRNMNVVHSYNVIADNYHIPPWLTYRIIDNLKISKEDPNFAAGYVEINGEFESNEHIIGYVETADDEIVLHYFI